jgi:DMSO/TMAO reductase YedYZ molybdopterin-dependent catalytic subunit
MTSLSRRRFLASSAALPLLLRERFLTARDDLRFPGLIVRNSEPKNLEFPFSFLKDKLIPNEQFFVRSHFAVPHVEKDKWTLSVEGAVKEKATLTYDDLLKLPATTVTSVLECAGNWRVFLKPSVGGLQWGQGAVGCAKWKGVSVATLLDRAGMKEGAVEVVFEGTDKGQINTDPKSPGPIHFDRGLPLSKVLQRETILAYAMNDAPLPADHGGPVRLIVPGWFGMASVKWVKRLVVVAQPYQGFWQTLDYSYWVRQNGSPTLVPLTEMQVKASIAAPALNEVVAAGQKTTIRGAAWAGESPVAKVEVSTDGGQSWNPARLPEEPRKYEWSFWEYEWRVPAEKGVAKLLARATDAKGNTQPLERDPDRRSYMVNHLVPVEVTVR